MNGERNGSVVRVWCDGCFDLVHYGHANSLRQAKHMGDVLVVGVHNDRDITANKGPPVFKEEERYKMVRGIKWVDKVVEGSTYWPTVQTLDQYGCDFAAHGDDLSITKDGRDPYSALRDAGKLKLFKRTEGVSTTDIVGRMLLMTKEHHEHKEGLSPTHSKLARTINQDVRGNSPWTKMSQFLQTSNKIVQFSEGKEPKEGDKIVYVSGDWDLLHPGHLDFLEEARKEGDYLIVGLHTDMDVNSKKGTNYPIMNLHERTLSVLGCRYASEVIIGAPYNVTKELMDQFKIDLVIHGRTEVPPDNDPYVIPKQLGKFKTIDTGNLLKTSHIVQRIIEHRLEFLARNSKKEERELVASAKVFT